MVTSYEWVTRFREVISKLPKFMTLKHVDSINFDSINFGAPLDVSDDYEWMGFTAAANVMMTLYEWNVSFRELREVISKLPKFMVLKHVDSINFDSINFGALLDVSDDYEWMGFTTAANVMMTLYEWDTSFREVISKLPKFMALKHVDIINFDSINFGAPLDVSDDYERMGFTVDANVILTLCEWDTSFREVSNKPDKFMALKQVDREPDEEMMDGSEGALDDEDINPARIT